MRGPNFLGPPALLAEPDAWPDRVIVMTLARVGSGAGPDFSRIAAIRALAGPRKLYAAGGIRGAADLADLARAGVAGGGERMLDLVALRDHLRGLGLAGHRARERLLGGAIIVILDLLVIGRIPMDEHPDADEEIVRLGFRDDAFGDAVGDRLGHRMLRRPEHLHGLLGPLDGHLVEQNRRRLAGQVWGHQRKQRGEAFLVVRQGIRERGLGCAAARSDQEIDVGDLVAFADERFTDAEFRDLCHLPTLLPRKSDASPTATCPSTGRMATLVVSIRQEMPDRLAG